MSSIFTKIIAGQVPGRFVWNDEHCVAILSISPLAPGHTLVIPRKEVDHWLDLDRELSRHLFASGQAIGKAIQQAFTPVKVGLMIAGLEVRHVHLHLVPINNIHDLDFSRQDKNPDPKMMDDAAMKIRAALREMGYEQVGEKHYLP